MAHPLQIHADIARDFSAVLLQARRIYNRVPRSKALYTALEKNVGMNSDKFGKHNERGALNKCPWKKFQSLINVGPLIKP